MKNVLICAAMVLILAACLVMTGCDTPASKAIKLMKQCDNGIQSACEAISYE